MTESVAELTLPASRLSQRSRTRDPAPTLGWFPVLALLASLGLALIAVADARSRSMQSSSQALFWIGLAIVYAPIAARLAHSAPRRFERILLVALLGLGLYLVKVFLDPFGFTFADELVHTPNAEAILRTHHLFHPNSILTVTPSFPGLESVTAALSGLSGLTTYGAGLIVVGVARLLIVIALFLLSERVLGSSRAAGLAVAIYAANSNFVFFSAQFSYESLALPLLVVVLFAYAEWRSAISMQQRRLYACVVILLTFAVVATHHLTSYALVVALIAIALMYRVMKVRGGSPSWFAAFAFVAALAWLLVVGHATVGYLSPVVTRAFTSVIHTITGEAAPRQLFAPKGGNAAPVGIWPISRGVALAGVGVLALLYPFGVFQIWRRYRRDPFAIVLAIGGGLVFASYPLRFAPDAWETANRSTEFLFIGLAVALPLAILRLGQRLGERTLMLAAAATLTLAFAGGVIAGWTPNLRLSQPYDIVASGTTIPPEGRAMASWANETLGQNRHYAAAEADARLLNTYAAGQARAGQAPDVGDILKTSTIDSWMLPLLQKFHIRYIVTDRRIRAFDNTAGYYFGFSSGSRRDEKLPVATVRKFHKYNRIYDSGNIVIFDLGLQ